MSCPFLSGRQIKVCSAFQGTLVLDVEELKTCTTDVFQTCKTYKKRLQCGDRLPLQEYRKDRLLSVL